MIFTSCDVRACGHWMDKRDPTQSHKGRQKDMKYDFIKLNRGTGQTGEPEC